MTAVLRDATPDDIDAVVSFWLRHAEPTSTDSPEAVAALLAFDPGALIVAESDGDIVGSVVAGWDGWRGSIYRLAVAPASRRAGLATALLQAAEARLAGLGAQRVHAIVVGSNAPAVAFWDASGWGLQEGQRRYAKG
ncbi:MAG TPA: GNAT family N-acetyltransferase [Acidimicrobiales bacterium]|nr:GNAT family N-acetyltransferase [Acidimicrobiales bacterium]